MVASHFTAGLAGAVQSSRKPLERSHPSYTSEPALGRPHIGARGSAASVGDHSTEGLPGWSSTVGATRQAEYAAPLFFRTLGSIGAPGVNPWKCARAPSSPPLAQVLADKAFNSIYRIFGAADTSIIPPHCDPARSSRHGTSQPKSWCRPRCFQPQCLDVHRGPERRTTPPRCDP